MKKLTFLVVGLAGVYAFAPGAAGWPQCPPREVPLHMRNPAEVTLEELFVEADRVVLGEVAAVEARMVTERAPQFHPGAVSRSVVTFVTLVPEKRLKGNTSDREIEIRVPGGRWEKDGRTFGGTALFVGGTPVFEKGQRVLVFLRAAVWPGVSAAENESYFQVILGRRGQYIVRGDSIYNAMLCEERPSTPLAALLDRVGNIAWEDNR